MALQLDNFKEVGGSGNSAIGGQIYSVFSDTDTIATMLGAGYLSDLSPTLNARDLVHLSAVDGAHSVYIVSNTAGVILAEPTQSYAPSQQLTDPIAFDLLASETIEVTTTTSINVPLQNGAIGQKITIILINDGGDLVVSPALLVQGSTLSFDQGGELIEMLFTSNGWTVVVNDGVTIGA